MEVMDNNGNGKGQQDSAKPETPKPTHEQMVRQFAGELNEILSKGYPLTAVLQVLDAAVFELRMGMYMQQMEMLERERQNQKRIEIPQMQIPTKKNK